MTEPIKNGLTPAVEQRIREIVREELAAQRSGTVALAVGSQEIGRAAVKAINDLQSNTGKTILDV